MKYAILLYQVGLANVFAVHTDGTVERLVQHAFDPCIWFARGLHAAGVPVYTKHWDGAGDAALFQAQWESGPGDLWIEKKVTI